MSYNTRKSSVATSILQNKSASYSDNDFSESESDFEISESESSDTSTTEEEASSSNASDVDSNLDNSKKLPSRTLKKHNNAYVIKSDDYFFNSGKKKAITSNNVFGKIDAPRLQQEQLEKLLSSQDVMLKHTSHLKLLSERNHEQFTKWLYILKEGFNVLLYGLGSKIKILQDFIDTSLCNMPVIVVNGFFPSLSIKNIIDSIINDVLELSESPGSIYDACDLIAQEMIRLRNMCIYIIIYNIEGDMLKNQKAQSVLSKLATISNIHMIASIDHVSGPLIWDNSKLSKFNFLWYDVTSFLPYLKETSFKESNVVQRSKTLVLSSLNNVFLSLTSNSKGIYMVIVKYQLDNGRTQHYQGLAFKDLYWSCREAFLVSSDLALRSQLTEFVDHKMLRIKRSIDGTEYIVIPTAINILQQFRDEQSA